VLRPRSSNHRSLFRSPRTLVPKNRFCNKSTLITRCRYMYDRLCLLHPYSICVKASRLHNIRFSKDYYTHTVLRGLTRQNDRVWPTKLRVFGAPRCTLSIAVAYLCVDTTKPQYVLTTYETSNSFRVLKYRILLFKLFTTYKESILFNFILIYWMPQAV
jgi:hypothetical protein